MIFQNENASFEAKNVLFYDCSLTSSRLRDQYPVSSFYLFELIDSRNATVTSISFKEMVIPHRLYSLHPDSMLHSVPQVLDMNRSIYGCLVKHKSSDFNNLHKLHNESNEVYKNKKDAPFFLLSSCRATSC